MNLKSSIATDAVQAVLDSAPNAAQKGQAQWHTPAEWAKALALPLPDFRPGIVDLCCGNGALLQGVRHKNTGHLLGCEIQPIRNAKCKMQKDGELQPSFSAGVHRITADVTALYPLLLAAQFRADLFALNPPWDLHWYRERLSPLADSHLPAVQAAFNAHDGRCGRDTIDSTIASLCLALDLSSHYGEGFLIANEATLQRLLFADDAPHRALLQHVWARVSIPGNICQPVSSSSSSSSSSFSTEPFHTAVLYFARGHTAGPQVSVVARHPLTALDEVRKELLHVKWNRVTLCDAAPLKSFLAHCGESSLAQWKAAGEEYRRLNDPTQQHYNLWLDHVGIRTALSLFDSLSGRVDKDAAAKLHDLAGHTPMRLVLKRESRRALLAATAPGSPWHVDPALTEAVARTVARYEAQRTPLVALNPIQRLGYLDEFDFITCRADLGDGNPSLQAGAPVMPLWRAGQRYGLRTTSVMVKRSGKKMNLHGEYDDVQWDGQELAIFIHDDFGVERLFMEARLRDPHVKVSVVAPAQRAVHRRLQVSEVVEACGIDFTLPELVAHFEIPEVPDVAAKHPAAYQHNLQLLQQIEQLVNLNP